MDRNRLLKHIVLLMVFMFLANTVILKLHLYYSLWWIDMVMHFLGGLWVGLFFLYVFYTRGWFSNKVLAVILSVLFIGLLWELYELYIGIIAHEAFSPRDTISDIIFDMAGGTLAVIYFLKQKTRATGSLLV